MAGISMGMNVNSNFAVAIAVGALVAPLVGYAHGEKPHSAKAAKISKDVHAWGQQGDVRMVTRTLNITMRDTMRFDPSFLSVKRGETVKIVIHNAGAMMHELVFYCVLMELEF